MRVPRVEHFTDSSTIKHVHYQAPILIPRHPVITNDRQRDKCIKQIEKKVRTSMEYAHLIKYLRTNMEMDRCEFFHNFKAGKRRGMIEIHHAPFDLYSLSDIVMKKFEKENGYINQNLVAEEVAELHYSGLVGLIPLSVTVHELVHDGKIIVPLNCVYGRFVEFTQRYYEFIDDSLMDMLNQNIELTKKLSRKDLSILNVAYVYTDTDGVDLPDTIPLDSIKEAMDRAA